jgi:hypothetical protein
MAEDHIGYAKLLQRAFRDVIRGAIEHAAAHGLLGEHHFYLAFATRHPGVKLSPSLLAQYPEEMRIVLQHRFDDLEVSRDGFSVTLSFGGKAERLEIPFAAIVRFDDPAAGATFELGSGVSDEPPAEEPRDDRPSEDPEGNVVRLDRFRPRDT